MVYTMWNRFMCQMKNSLSTCAEKIYGFLSYCSHIYVIIVLVNMIVCICNLKTNVIIYCPPTFESACIHTYNLLFAMVNCEQLRQLGEKHSTSIIQLVKQDALKRNSI